MIEKPRAMPIPVYDQAYGLMQYSVSGQDC